jgi:hypothetical protein
MGGVISTPGYELDAIELKLNQYNVDFFKFLRIFREDDNIQSAPPRWHISLTPAELVQIKNSTAVQVERALQLCNVQKTVLDMQLDMLPGDIYAHPNYFAFLTQSQADQRDILRLTRKAFYAAHMATSSSEGYTPYVERIPEKETWVCNPRDDPSTNYNPEYAECYKSEVYRVHSDPDHPDEFSDHCRNCTIILFGDCSYNIHCLMVQADYKLEEYEKKAAEAEKKRIYDDLEDDLKSDPFYYEHEHPDHSDYPM